MEEAFIVNIKLLNNLAKIPTRGSEYAAGYDLYNTLTEKIILKPNESVKVPTGIATEITHGYFGAIFPRSGLATKQGLRLCNCVAVIDEDYRGEWLVPIINDSNEEQIIMPGDRIAQVIFLPYLIIDFKTVESLSDTTRGAGGFGHTGK